MIMEGIRLRCTNNRLYNPRIRIRGLYMNKKILQGKSGIKAHTCIDKM